jgi:hypothetical protein
MVGREGIPPKSDEKQECKSTNSKVPEFVKCRPSISPSHMDCFPTVIMQHTLAIKPPSMSCSHIHRWMHTVVILYS